MTTDQERIQRLEDDMRTVQKRLRGFERSLEASCVEEKMQSVKTKVWKPQVSHLATKQQVLQTQTVPETNRPTFWTRCRFCSVRYQYYKEFLNRTLHCRSCKRKFIAYEMNSSGGTNGISLSQPNVSQQQGDDSHAHFAAMLSKPTRFSSKNTLLGMFSSDANQEPERNDNARKKRNMSAESRESIETRSTTVNWNINMITEEDGDDQLGQNSGYDTVKNLRTAQFNQQSQKGDDVLPNPSKRLKQSQFMNPGVSFEKDKVQEQAGFVADITKRDKEASCVDEKMQSVKTKDGGCENFSLSGDIETSSKPKYSYYLIPDFSDFEEHRRVEGFSPGQLWALYDELDGMPRFYALIEQVMSPGFKVRMTWLEPDPEDDDQIKWVSVGLPTSCGKFKLGSTEDNEHHRMFSHLANCERSKRRDMYTIYPRKGEIWAIFKDWDVNWYSTLMHKTCYEFEFVEIMSDYADDIGIRVAYLSKIKGFASLFCRTMKNGSRDFDIIPAEHMLKLSHMVPSFQMSGKEGKNVPAGSFELDTAALPASHEGIEVLQNINIDNIDISLKSSSSAVGILQAGILQVKHDLKQDGSPTKFVDLKAKSSDLVSLSYFMQLEALLMGRGCLADDVRPKGSAFLTETTHLKAEDPTNECLTQVTEEMELSQLCPIPDPYFHNFDADKTLDKFKVGQMWAMYCDEDALPKYYAIIKRIDPPPQFRLYVTWLAACPGFKDIIRWVDKKMPISCGNFKMRKTALKYDKTSAFSHKVKVDLSKEKGIYVILPQKGDVWTLYKDFSANITHPDLKKCKYEIVEVLEKNEIGFKVLVLDRVKGFKSVFRPKMQGSLTVNMLIPMAHHLRFSNQVPAVRLSEEKGGSLRGFWETDAAALPEYLLTSN